MPYTKRAAYRRRPYRRYKRKAKGTWGSWLSKGAWMAKQIWKLKGLVNSELYKSDLLETGTIVTYDGTYSRNLTALAVGDDDSSRTGNSAYIRSVNLKGQVIWNQSSTAVAQYVRVMVVIDTQQVGDTLPTLANVLSSVNTASSYNTHLNADTVGRFKILYSKIHELDIYKAASRDISFNIPMRHHVRYNGNASTDIQKGGIYLMAISSEQTNGPTIRYDVRTSYHDN